MKARVLPPSSTPQFRAEAVIASDKYGPENLGAPSCALISFVSARLALVSITLSCTSVEAAFGGLL